MIIRFLGTTPDSSSVLPMLTSICKQICYNYDQPIENIPDELSPLVIHLKKLLTCATQEKPLVIVLDSLDQLSPADDAHQMAWLPVELPPHVKIILSVLPNYYGILDKLRKMFEGDENYIQVTPLGENLGSVILKHWLENAKQSVTDAQWSIVQNAISRCNLPLFVKLVFDEICRWKSYSPPVQTKLAFTIHDSITQLYERVENQHGRILVMHALGYITASKSGLSEAELEDLLSLDEKVLNDVYQYHLPPVRRIPPLLWTRIRNDLPGYFAERDADGVNVIDWYHRQFIEASRERYFRNLNVLSEMHYNMAEYFRGTWAGIPKPFEYSELQRSRFGLTDKKGDSDRKVPAMPLEYTDASGKVIRFNLRKLNEYPYHLIRSHRYDVLFEEVLFNYNFLHAKLSCMPLTALLSDFEDYLAVQYDKDVKLLADALRLSASILTHHPDMLGPQIIGRLLPYYNSSQKIRILIQQCDTHGLTHCALLPSYHCQHTPGGPLQFSLEGHQFAPFGICVTSDARYLVSVSNKFVIWDLETGDVFRSVTPGIEGIMQNLVLSPDDKTACSFTNKNQVLICTIMTGEFKHLAKPVEGDEDILGCNMNNSTMAVWTAKHWYLYTKAGVLISKNAAEKHQQPMMHVDLGDKDEYSYLMMKSGEPNDDDMTLVINDEIEPFEIHSAMRLTRDMQTLYACIAISDNAVAVYKREGNVWKYDRTLAENQSKLFSLRLSLDENYLVGTTAKGYMLWCLKTDKVLELQLPAGVRNIPNKNQMSSMVLFSKSSEFVVAGVRKNLYVWDVKAGTLTKTLDAHFGRIIALCLVTAPGQNKIISSSFDKTIKVWNFDNILENVNCIDRCEKPIEAISLGRDVNLAATTTRNCVGIWNLDDGRLQKTLANSQHSSIITHAVLVGNGKHVISAESGNILIWDVEKEKVLKIDPQRDILQITLMEKDTKFLTFSKSAPNKVKCICRTVPEGEVVYQFEYQFKPPFKNAVITSEKSFLVCPAVDKNNEIISIFHSKTGTHINKQTPKWSDYKDYTHIIAMPNDTTQIAFIDQDKGNIWDVKKKKDHFIRSVKKWNGYCPSIGKIGLYAPDRGGLEILELRHGRVVHTLLPKVAEGVHKVRCMFTKNDRNVIYYHTGHKTIRVFRVADGTQIANYKVQAEISAMEGSHDGASLVLGAVDGSLTTLCIADLEDEESAGNIAKLPSRQVSATNPASGSPKRAAAGNGHIPNGNAANSSIGATMQVARFVAKAKTAQKSRACVLQ